MDSTILTVLSVLIASVLLLLIQSVRHVLFITLCYCLFTICIVLSACVSCFAVGHVPGWATSTFGSTLATLLSMSAIAVLAFMILYRIIAIGIVSAMEIEMHTTLMKPDILWGFVCAALSPIVIAIWNFVWLFHAISTGQLWI